MSEASCEPSIAPPPAKRQRTVKRPPAVAFKLVIENHLPGREGKDELDWDTNRIFYKLEKVFGRNAVLSMNGHEIPKFKNMQKVCEDFDVKPETATLTISTERQLKEIQYRILQKKNGEAVEEEPAAAPATPDTVKFSVNLQDKKSSFEVEVTPETTIKELVQWYIERKGVPGVSKVVVDGDEVGLEETIGDLDIQEHESIDMHL